MDNKTIQDKKDALLSSLTPQQKEFFPAFDWFYNGQRGSGKTYLSCVAALVGLLNGQHEVFVLEHHSYNESSIQYIRHMINVLANKIELAIEMKEFRGGIVVRKAPEYMQYEIDYKKNRK